MILFIDDPKMIRIVRLVASLNGTKRERLGAINKFNPDPSAPVLKQLTEAERLELDEILGLVKKKEEMQARLDIARLPDILRNTIEYVSTDRSTIVEKRFLLATLTDALNKVRKIETIEAD